MNGKILNFNVTLNDFTERSHLCRNSFQGVPWNFRSNALVVHRKCVTSPENC